MRPLLAFVLRQPALAKHHQCSRYGTLLGIPNPAREEAACRELHLNKGVFGFFAQLAPEQIEPGLERLRRDLASGDWHARHADLLDLEQLDLGYRLIVGG